MPIIALIGMALLLADQSTPYAQIPAGGWRCSIDSSIPTFFDVVHSVGSNRGSEILVMSTFNLHSLRAVVILAVIFSVLPGCSTTTSRPTEQGTSNAVTFPDMKSAWPEDGTFPNTDNLRLLAPGMTKDQLYELVGRPHFKEGMVDVREWDYLFNFRTDQPAPNDVLKCQMKVLFDKDMLSRSYFWAPESCAAFLKKPVVAHEPVSTAAPVPVARTNTLSGDALFAFNGAGANDLLPNGRREVEALAAELAGQKSVSRVEVLAYTDRLGSARYNQALSQRRAETVRDLLARQGVDPRVIVAQGMGKSHPVSQCGSMPKPQLISCLAPDRRVEIRSVGAK